MIDLLEKLQRSRATKHDYPCLFDDTNIQSVYNMLDPTNRGFITLQQYKEGKNVEYVADCVMISTCFVFEFIVLQFL